MVERCYVWSVNTYVYIIVRTRDLCMVCECRRKRAYTAGEIKETLIALFKFSRTHHTHTSMFFPHIMTEEDLTKSASTQLGNAYTHALHPRYTSQIVFWFSKRPREGTHTHYVNQIIPRMREPFTIHIQRMWEHISHVLVCVWERISILHNTRTM